MTNIKIFISSELYFGCTDGYLFGYVKQFQESIAFYLLRSCSNDKKSNGQLLGAISNGIECTGANDVLNFVQFVNGPSNILLNRVTTIRDVPIKSVQIILYDHIKWIEASADWDGDVDTINEDCIIKCLGRFIQDDLNGIKSVDKNTNSCNTKVFGFAVISVLNMVNKLAVVKHLMDWWHCLNGGLRRKYTIRCSFNFLHLQHEITLQTKTMDDWLGRVGWTCHIDVVDPPGKAGTIFYAIHRGNFSAYTSNSRFD